MLPSFQQRHSQSQFYNNHHKGPQKHPFIPPNTLKSTPFGLKFTLLLIKTRSNLPKTATYATFFPPLLCFQASNSGTPNLNSITTTTKSVASSKSSWIAMSSIARAGVIGTPSTLMSNHITTKPAVGVAGWQWWQWQGGSGGVVKICGVWVKI
jgi:hypothetical protein